MNCDTLTKPANGQVSHTGGTTFGQTATYSCDTGYDLVGDNTRMCQATGVWSENAPICHGMFLLKLDCYTMSKTITQNAHITQFTKCLPLSNTALETLGEYNTFAYTSGSCISNHNSYIVCRQTFFAYVFGQ